MASNFVPFRPRPPGAKALDSDLADVAFKRREEARKAGKRATRDAAAEELEAGKGEHLRLHEPFVNRPKMMI